MNKIIDSRITRALAAQRQPFRGRVSASNSVPNVQLLQIGGVAKETLQAAEYFQHFGFTSNPPAGSQCIVLPLGGKTAQAVIVATENSGARVKALASGETAIYNADGTSIVLHADGSVTVNAAGIVTVNSPKVMVPTGDVVASGISLINHVHSHVQAGTANTGAATG